MALALGPSPPYVTHEVPFRSVPRPHARAPFPFGSAALGVCPLNLNEIKNGENGKYLKLETHLLKLTARLLDLKHAIFEELIFICFEY